MEDVRFLEDMGKRALRGVDWCAPKNERMRAVLAAGEPEALQYIINEIQEGCRRSIFEEEETRLANRTDAWLASAECPAGLSASPPWKEKWIELIGTERRERSLAYAEVAAFQAALDGMRTAGDVEAYLEAHPLCTLRYRVMEMLDPVGSSRGYSYGLIYSCMEDRISREKKKELLDRVEKICKDSIALTERMREFTRVQVRSWQTDPDCEEILRVSRAFDVSDSSVFYKAAERGFNYGMSQYGEAKYGYVKLVSDWVCLFRRMHGLVQRLGGPFGESLMSGIVYGKLLKMLLAEPTEEVMDFVVGNADNENLEQAVVEDMLPSILHKIPPESFQTYWVRFLHGRKWKEVAMQVAVQQHVPHKRSRASDSESESEQ